MRPLLILLLGLASAHTALSQARDVEFPKEAVIHEKRTLPLANKRSRTLVLWMLNPKKNPNGYKPDDIYTCPDHTRGSYYSGPTRVSLVNAATGKVINTLNIQMDSDEDGGANVDVPTLFVKAIITESTREQEPALKQSRPSCGCATTMAMVKPSNLPCLMRRPAWDWQRL